MYILIFTKNTLFKNERELSNLKGVLFGLSSTTQNAPLFEVYSLPMTERGRDVFRSAGRSCTCTCDRDSEGMSRRAKQPGTDSQSVPFPVPGPGKPPETGIMHRWHCEMNMHRTMDRRHSQA